MSSSKISVDLTNRTFEVDVDREDLSEVFSMLSELFAKHSNVPAASPTTETIEVVDEQTGAEAGNNPPKPKRSKSKGPAKVRTYKIVDLGIGSGQRQEIKKFFEEKGPKGQSNEVATLAFALKEKMNKNTFSCDEIHSAFKIANRPTPKNLIAVFGNMKRDGIAGYENNEIHVNSFTEDHVNFHMNSGE